MKDFLYKLFRMLIGVGDVKHLENFQELEDFEKGFREFYKKHLSERLLKAEKTRIYYVSIITRRLFVLFIIFILLTILLLKYSLLNYNSLVFLLILSSFLLWWAFLPKKKYSHDVKKAVFKPIFRYLGDFSFSPNGNSNIEKFSASGILPEHKSYETEDHITGHYRKVNFEIEEVALYRSIVAGKGKEVYRGLIILLDCPKPFYGRTVVISSRSKLPKLLNKKYPDLKRVFLKNPAVEAEYNVYGSSRDEAGYLLVNAFIERISNLGNVFAQYNPNKKRGVECSFFDNKLMLAVECRRNLFEIGSVFSPITTDDLRMIIAQVHWLFKIIDTLFHKLPSNK